MNKSVKLLLFLILSVALLLLPACGKTADEAAETENAANGTVTGTDTGAEYESENGDTHFQVDMEKSVDLPEGYPEDLVPVYPNSRVYISEKQGEGFGVGMKSDDSIDDIYTYYEKNLQLDQVLNQFNSNGTAAIMGVIGGKSVMVNILPNNLDGDGKSLISIAIGEGE